MKVLEIMPEFGLAGAETMCENLSVEFKKNGWDVIVVSLYDFHSPITDRLEEKEIPVLYLHKKPGLDFSMIPALYRLFRKEKPDLVHTHRYVMQYVIPAAVLAGVRKRYHTVHNIASKETTQIAQKLNMIFYHLCHVTPIALSAEIQHTVMERYHLPKERIPVIYNGVPLQKCLVKTDYHTDETFQFLHVGRFARAKNHPGLLKAFKEVLNLGVKAHLTLVGSGEMEKQIREEVTRLQLEEAVTFYGTTGDIYPLFQNADAFVLPSLYEGMPMTLIEAMGTGLPILASKVGGIPSMLEDGKEAVLTETNLDSIKEGMLRLLDEDLRKQIGTAARNRAKEEFSAEKMAESYAELFRR